MKFIIATKNEHKLEEFRRILNPFGIEVLSQTDVGVDIDVIENATTFEGNARLKAQAIFDATGLPTIADDSGLEVYSLNNQPGVYSARYGGEACITDKQRYELLLKNLDGVKERGAQFVCSIYLIIDSDKHFSFTGVCKGEIGFFPQGEGGFGYDPIFMVNGKSFSQIDGIAKDRISHRGKALIELKKIIETRTNI